MFRIGKTLSWIFLVIFFVVLIGIATTFYEADQSERDKLTNNELVNKGRSLVEWTTKASGMLASNKFEQNTGPSNKLLEFFRGLGNLVLTTKEDLPSSDNTDQATSSIDIDKVVNIESVNTLMDEGASLLTEGADIFNKEKFTDLGAQLSDAPFWRYEKTDEGAQIILRNKAGEDYVIPLPFKFLK
jgi:hypothetical protein